MAWSRNDVLAAVAIAVAVIGVVVSVTVPDVRCYLRLEDCPYRSTAMRNRLIGKWCDSPSAPSRQWVITASGSNKIHTRLNGESLENVWSVTDLGNQNFKIAGTDEGGTDGQVIFYRFVSDDSFKLVHTKELGILTPWQRCEVP